MWEAAFAKSLVKCSTLFLASNIFISEKSAEFSNIFFRFSDGEGSPQRIGQTVLGKLCEEKSFAR